MVVAPRALLALLLPVAANAGTGSKFSYDESTAKGPADWPSLDLGGPTNACGGSKQSGIDIPRTTCDEEGADYIFSAGTCNLDNIKFSISDHSLEAAYDTSDGCVPPRMTIPGKPVPYEALQFHMHTGTDHALDGSYYGADLHLVHKEIGGSGLAVLGFFIEPTNPNDGDKFQDLLEEWEAYEAATAASCSLTNDTDTSPQGGGRNLREGGRQLPRSFNPYNLVPDQSSMYTYEGSLTTPPCTEIVFWNVIDKAVSVSVREFLRLTNLILDYVEPTQCEVGASVAAPSGFTGRPVQDRNGRSITHLCPTGFVDPIQEVIDNQGQDPEEPDSTTSGSASVVSIVGAVSAIFLTAANFLM